MTNSTRAWTSPQGATPPIALGLKRECHRLVTSCIHVAHWCDPHWKSHPPLESEVLFKGFTNLRAYKLASSLPCCVSHVHCSFLCAQAKLLDINFHSTFNVFGAAVVHGVPRVVGSSSAFAFGWSHDPLQFVPAYLPIDERHPSLACETYVEFRCRQYDCCTEPR